MFKNLQMQNKELQAETKDDSEQMPIVIPSSPNAAKPNVIGSALSEFLNENLQNSKEERWSNEMFGRGWKSALMHVKVNFLEKL